MKKGKIIKGIGGLYYVDCENVIYECNARGKFRKNKITPTIGDMAEISVIDGKEKKGAVEKIFGRKNCLIRPKVANVDTAVITFAAKKPELNYDLADRFIVMCEYQEIKDIIICINKTDIADDFQKEHIKKIYEAYNIIFTSALEGGGIDELKKAIEGKTVFFAGPSGAGKSSLINCLINKDYMPTGEISRKISRGKHTTRHIELISAGNNTFIADTPGFTSLITDMIKPENLQYYFREFSGFTQGCRYSDCVHIHEPECRIKERVPEFIPEERYKRYVLLYNELKNMRK